MTYIEKKRYISAKYPTYSELLDKFMETDTRRWELEDLLDSIGSEFRSLRAKNDLLQYQVEQLQWALRREQAKQK